MRMMHCYFLQDGIPILTDLSNKSSRTPEWIDLVNPTEAECLEIGEHFGIPIDHLHAALDLNERPRIESGGGILLVITRAPVQTRESDDLGVPFYTCPVAAILASGVLVTVCAMENLTKNLLTEKIRSTDLRTGSSFMLTLLFRISTTFIEHLQDLDRHVVDIEKTLQKSMQNRELLRMLHIDKSLIYFLMALKGNASVLEKLGANTLLVESEAEKEFLYDVFIENKQATDMASIYTEIMGSIGDTFGAIVSNNLNKVMRVLASLAIVFMIPSMIGALYGMNVPLPFQENRFAFAILCLLCFVLSFGVYKLLKNWDWL